MGASGFAGRPHNIRNASLVICLPELAILFSLFHLILKYSYTVCRQRILKRILLTIALAQYRFINQRALLPASAVFRIITVQ